MDKKPHELEDVLDALENSKPIICDDFSLAPLEQQAEDVVKHYAAKEKLRAYIDRTKDMVLPNTFIPPAGKIAGRPNLKYVGEAHGSFIEFDGHVYVGRTDGVFRIEGDEMIKIEPAQEKKDDRSL